MQLSAQTQAILLLTAWFGNQDGGGAKPLTPTEWGRFALHLVDIGRKPGDLLHVTDVETLLSGFSDKKITSSRIHQLLQRSVALGIALEKWQRAGLWVMTRSDLDYPRRWKQRLKNDAPPILFGAGNRDLLNRGGISVVGSRDLDESQVAYTGELGRNIAYQGQTVISGGARGADEAAMLGALQSEGMAVGVLADSLLRTCTSAKYRKALMSNDLALVSPFNPEAGFNVGNAMARNKYIYCLSDAAIVIAATENKGGTWTGALEDLKNDWVPLWIVKSHADGNKALVGKGANWLPEEFDVGQLLGRGSADDGQGTAPRAVGEEVSAYAAESSVAELAGVDNAVGDVATRQDDAASQTHVVESTPESQQEPEIQETPYQFFLDRLNALLGAGPLTSKELQNATLLKQRQLSEWLKQAESDGVVVKTKSPVKYQLHSDEDAVVDASSTGGAKVTEAVKKTGPQTRFGF